MINPDHLQTFLAVAGSGNYTRAGEERHLSQSAVWRQMRQLEHSLAVPLFEQIGKKLHLTEAGRALRREAEAVLGHVGRVEEAIRAHGKDALGRLRIGASTTPGYYLLPPVLGAFHVRYPEVELHFEVDNSAIIEQRLLRNELDLAFVGGRIRHSELHNRQCADDHVVCFSSPSHALASRKRIVASALRRELCVIREKGSATRRLFESWIAERGGLPERTLVIRCPESLKTMVASGLGFSFLSLHGIRSELERGELVSLSVAGMSLRRPITMAWHVHKHLSPAIRAFMERIEASIASSWRSA